MIAVYQKELKSYFNNLFGYIYIALVLLFMGFFATAYHFKNYYFSDIAYSLQNLAFILLLVTPLLTMRIIAEERQRKTDTLLYSLPVSVTSTILGKYLAMLTVYLIPIGVISVYPIVLSWFGDINFAGAYNAVFGIFGDRNVHIKLDRESGDICDIDVRGYACYILLWVFVGFDSHDVRGVVCGSYGRHRVAWCVGVYDAEKLFGRIGFCNSL